MANGGEEVYKFMMFVLVITLPSGFNSDLDVGFIIDGSGSVNDKDPNNWRFLLDFVIKVVGKLPQQGTQVGVVVFSEKAQLRIKLNSHADLYSVMQSILRLHYPSSETNTSGALYIARTELFNVQNGDRPSASNLAILITEVDGPSRVDKEKTIPNAQDLHRDGIRVICIGISNTTNVPELRAISSPPHAMGHDYFIVKDFYSLGDLTYKLITTILPTVFEKTTQGFPRTTLNGSIVPSDDMESPAINLLAIIIPIISCIIIITMITVIIICIRRHSPGKCYRNNSNTSYGEDNEITQSATVTHSHVDIPGVYYNTSDDGRENINAMYEEIIENDTDSELRNCVGDKGKYEEVEGTKHTYQQLLTRQKPLTIKSWIEKNNLPNTLGKVLKQQNITTIPVLSLLTEKDIEDLGLSIGDRSQLRAAIKTLIED